MWSNQSLAWYPCSSSAGFHSSQQYLKYPRQWWTNESAKRTTTELLIFVRLTSWSNLNSSFVGGMASTNELKSNRWLRKRWALHWGCLTSWRRLFIFLPWRRLKCFFIRFASRSEESVLLSEKISPLIIDRKSSDDESDSSVVCGINEITESYVDTISWTNGEKEGYNCNNLSYSEMEHQLVLSFHSDKKDY